LSDFHRERFLERNALTRKLHEAEEKFMRVQNEAMAKGQVPVRFSSVGDTDLIEFGHHPSDGKTGSSCGTEMDRKIEEHIRRLEPRVGDWMRLVKNPEGPDRPPEKPTGDPSELESIFKELDLSDAEGDRVETWESISAIERRPRRRAHLRKHQATPWHWRTGQN
jgi:hypothetical protein